ncbi:hypothetical protein [Methylobacterium sp. 37f]|uniref:hypothetical protein n=1 Tax=Methylobacterium sp. 37f TaxID=2817058 RepID=UPI001FFD4125|nr:hypothetical protein [Methylobacterium sp. 37f]MCK2054202.1 hypothetical protein [Methylobacterium sp. 37f]
MELHVRSTESAGPAGGAALFGPRSLRRSYGRAAAEAAIENGLLPHELSALLAGRRVVEAFPVAGRESLADYADRAVAEMMVAYVSQPLA